MSAHPEFGEIGNATLAALIFELASQLQIERTRRLALEAALANSGIVMPAKIETVSEEAWFREEATKAADLSIRKLLRMLSESPDERVPLRTEAPGTTHGEH
ncbi:MAG: hypothetical protein ACREVV_02840 [Steroidobacteraceae bacterium]